MAEATRQHYKAATGKDPLKLKRGGLVPAGAGKCPKCGMKHGGAVKCKK